MTVRVMVKNNEPLEKTLKRLRKICNNEGITREIKRTSVYEKPSERRRRSFSMGVSRPFPTVHPSRVRCTRRICA